jgi:choice-of-anchor C domain-containing protein
MKRFGSKWTLGLAAVLVGGSMAGADTNLLVNGSFENGVDLGYALRLDPGSTAITGWVVTRDKIDYQGTIWQHSDGSRSVDLDGGATNAGNVGGIAQTFATTAGQTYKVTFDMAGNPGDDGLSLPEVKQMGVAAAGQSTTFLFDKTGYTYANMGWVSRQWQFTATGAQTTLEFYSLDTVGHWGPALDNVAVTAVPEPVTLGLLSLGGLAMLRRKR